MAVVPGAFRYRVSDVNIGTTVAVPLRHSNDVNIGTTVAVLPFAIGSLM